MSSIIGIQFKRSEYIIDKTILIKPRILSGSKSDPLRYINTSNWVQKPGRIGYDPTVFRTALKGDTKYAPANYKSVQSDINSGIDGTINRRALEKYLSTPNGKDFKIIDHTNLLVLRLINSGSRLAYITIDNKWRSGGYLVSVNKGEKTNNFEYILYKSFGNGIFSIQLCDIKQLYIKEKKKKQKEEI